MVHDMDPGPEDGLFVADNSGVGLVSFDFDIDAGSGTHLLWVKLLGEDGPFTFNANITSSSGNAIDSFTVTLENFATYDIIGDASDSVSITPSPLAPPFATAAEIDFDLGDNILGFELGDPTTLTGATDWQIAVDIPGGLGDSFEILLSWTVVPEPGTALLLGMGLVTFAGMRRRGGKRDA